jgi:hypothetical protein
VRARSAPDADHRAAYMAGRGGRAMPPGVAAKADADPSLDLMHDAGRGGIDYEAALRAHAPQLGAKSAPAPRRPRRRGLSRPGRPSLRRPLGGATRGADLPHTLGGVAVGAVLYALVLSVVDYGMKGPLYWFKAKFLNEPTAKPAGKPKPKGVLA